MRWFFLGLFFLFLFHQMTSHTHTMHHTTHLHDTDRWTAFVWVAGVVIFVGQSSYALNYTYAESEVCEGASTSKRAEEDKPQPHT